jgi:hypothetical protein
MISVLRIDAGLADIRYGQFRSMFSELIDKQDGKTGRQTSNAITFGDVVVRLSKFLPASIATGRGFSYTSWTPNRAAASVPGRRQYPQPPRDRGVLCRRYAVEDDQDRMTLDCCVYTDRNKHLGYGVLEYKSSNRKAAPPGRLTRLGLRPLKLSKFLWATQV